jgi:serine/threonine protein kinase/tetratricopeptide (TPR) repeat protein
LKAVSFLAPGQRLGPYQLVTFIGAGGMGEVYKATDTRLGRPVAIKTIHPAHMERFEREARAIAALNHPHICTLYDIGSDYLVMEYVEGQPLSGPLPVADAVRTALEIADALEAAHRAGVIHRDLKPANILVTSAGVKLLDFGLAKMIAAQLPDDTVTASQGGMILGTVAYMSPERLEGNPTDERSDIFSFGLVIYELLGGRRAFGGPTAASTMGAILHKDPPPLDTPPQLEQIVMRALRKAPADRFQTVSEMKAALLAAQAAGDWSHAQSIAVLPFANLTGGSESEYFSDGLAEDIINALTQVPGLRVVARTSAFAFKGKNEDARRIGEALGVAYILEGSVRRSDTRVRIAAQLIGVSDGSNLWSDRFDRQMIDIFAIQDEISQAIVEVLKVKLARPGQRMVPRRTSEPAAYQAYLEGRYYFQQYTPTSLARCCQFYERAIELDPAYAAPHAGLAEAYLYRTNYESTPVREVVPKALAAAERAIELDPNGAEGYVARGFVRGTCQFQWEAAGADFVRALELNPESPLAHYRRGAWYLMPLGRMEETLAEARRSVKLDPLSPLYRGVEVMALNLAGHDQETVERGRTLIEMFPLSFFTCLVAGLAMAGSGALSDAESALEQGLRVDPDSPWIMAVLAGVYARQGNSDQLAALRARISALQKKQWVASVVPGLVEAAAGNLDRAFELLEQAATEQLFWTIFLVRAPLFAKLLAGPKYDALLRKMNLI